MFALTYSYFAFVTALCREDRVTFFFFSKQMGKRLQGMIFSTFDLKGRENKRSYENAFKYII